MTLALRTIAATAAWLAAVSFAQAEVDWSAVDAALARKATIAGPVHKYGFPRSDLHVVVDGVPIKPGLALGGWVAFEPTHQGAAMMGDLVLLEGEVGPVMRALLDGGVAVTGVHNHLLRANPATYYMHVSGAGDPATLARMVRRALAQSKTPLEGSAPPPGEAARLDFDPSEIDRIIAFPGHDNSGVYQFSIPRAEPMEAGRMTILPGMGTAIALNFQPTGEGRAAVSGDFVALAKEVEPLLKALQSNGIEVTALHNHMLDEEPRLFFVHFWANDDATKLAKGLRAGLDVLNHAGPR